MDAGAAASDDIPPEIHPAESDAALARRAQILATEHWGLLAARSTAQSEVLTRITIFLTLVSAGLVTIGLLGQASAFSGWFTAALLAILAFLCLIGVMTQMRVVNVADEDLMYVVAMNRMRSGYVDLDPQVAQYFLASSTDDEAGMARTYSFLHRRSDFSHLFGSSAVLIIIVNACVYGMFAGVLVQTVSGALGWAIVTGALVGVAWAITGAFQGYRTYQRSWSNYVPRRPTNGPPIFWRDQGS